MRLVTTVFALLTGAVPFAAQAQQPATTTTAAAVEKGKAAAIETTKVSATVVAIDAATREVTLKGADGKVFTVAAGDEVRNFNQIKVGDIVNAQYTRAVSLEIKKGGTPIGHPTAEQTVARAPLGAKPAGVVSHQVTALAEVIAVDAKNHLVSLRGPAGNQIDVDVLDPEQLKHIKKGDHLEVVYTEALAVSVEEAPAAASSPPAAPKAAPK